MKKNLHALLRHALLIGVSLSASAAAQAASDGYQIHIPEMHCESCAAALTGTFSKRPEVASVEADIAAHTLTVSLKPDAKLSEATMRELVQASGFTPEEISKAQD